MNPYQAASTGGAILAALCIVAVTICLIVGVFQNQNTATIEGEGALLYEPMAEYRLTITETDGGWAILFDRDGLPVGTYTNTDAAACLRAVMETMHND